MIFLLYKRILSDKILLFLNIFIIFIIINITYKFFQSNKEISTFYLNFIIYFSFILFILFVILIQKSNKIKIVCKIIIFSVILSLYVIEIYLNFVHQTQTSIEDLQNRQFYAKKLGIKFDTRSKYEVLNNLLEKGEIVFPTMPPNDVFSKTSKFFTNLKNPIYPLSNISNSKTVFCNESGERIIYKTDRYGFRNKDNIWDEDKIDVAIVGDSLVHGACVDDEFVISTLLNKISGKNILNLGVQGYGPLLQLAALKEYAYFKKPKVVLWYYSEANDLGNLNDEWKFEIIRNYKKPSFSQNLITKQNLINQQLKDLIELVKYSEGGTLNHKEIQSKNKSIAYKKSINYLGLIRLHKLRDFLNHFLPQDKSIIRYRYSDISAIDEYFKILKLADDLVKSWDGKIVVVYHPHLSRYMGNRLLTYGQKQYDTFLKRIKDLDIDLIDIKMELFDTLESPTDIYHFGLPGHPNEYGYQITAEKFNDFLTK